MRSSMPDQHHTYHAFEQFLAAILPALNRNIQESARKASHIAVDKQSLLDVSTEASASNSDLQRYLYEPLEHFSMQGGKRIRPALWILGAYVFDPQVIASKDHLNDLLALSTACEHFQTAALIHDDIADKSSYRRGEACMYKTEGTGIALNVGDCALVYALCVICQAKSISTTVKQQLIDEFCAMEQLTIEGQALDLGWARDGRWDLETDDYLIMAQKKTAYYSCATPLVLGALCASAPHEAIEALRSFGAAAGLAFQIQDDYLNIFGDAAAQGKDFRSDIIEGKRTFFSLYALQHLRPEECERLKYLLSAHAHADSTTAEDMRARSEEAARLIEASGARRAGKTQAQALLDRAQQQLSPELFSPDAQKLLNDLCRLFVERTR